MVCSLFIRLGEALLIYCIELFEDADEFKPERYLGSHTGIRPGVDASDFRDTIAFGAGRVS